MADGRLDAPPGYAYTLFGLEPAPIDPVWKANAIQKAKAGAKKLCTFCHEVKPVTQFNHFARARDGLHGHCKPCRNAQSRARYKNSPKAKKRVTDTHRVRKYGLTEADFNKMFEAQGGKCAICRDALRPGRFTHVDHCHRTGRVRAILCRWCNARLGIIEGMPNDIGPFHDYLQKYGG